MQKQNEWMSISDMMSGLMLIFLFVAVSFMLKIDEDKKVLEKQKSLIEKSVNIYKQEKKQLEKQKNKIEQIALAYQKAKIDLNLDLHKEFDKDLKKWDAQITKNNSIIFNSPEVLFEIGKSNIKERFKLILDDFFPRYIKILTKKKYINEIEEIRIEGHTSNRWFSAKDESEIYLNNMKLSQERANSVLRYVYLINTPFIINKRGFLEQKLRANGMAYAKLKYKDVNKTIIDYIHSRRVEFSVRLKTEEKIYNILKAGSD